MKVLRVTMPDGSKWDVPAEKIAENRALYYSDGERNDEYNKEFEFTINSDFELRDWAANNMNWEDVQGSATKVENIPQSAPDYQEGWVNGPKEIVEIKE